MFVRVFYAGCVQIYQILVSILFIVEVIWKERAHTPIKGILLWSPGIVGYLDATTLVQRVVEEVEVGAPVEAVVDWS